MVLCACSGDSPQEVLSSAKQHLAQNDRKAAVIQLKNALQMDASLAEARYLLGKTLFESGDVGGAVIELGKARELANADDSVTALLARARLQQGQSDKLVQDFGETKLSTAKAMADLQATLALAYGSMGKSAEARASIDKSLGLDPDNQRARLIQVRLMAEAGGAPAALAALDAHAEKILVDAEAWQLKGELLTRLKQPDAAIAAFREALKRDKQYSPAHVGLVAQLMARPDKEAVAMAIADFKATQPNHPQLRLFIAGHALETGDLKTAGEQVQALLKSVPNDMRVQFLAGALEFRRGSLLQAENHLLRALKSAPKAVRVRVLLARTHLRAGEPTKAQAVLQPLLDADVPDASLFAAAAEAQFQLGNAKLAESYLGRAVSLNPEDVRSRTALAVVSVGKGQADRGLATLRSIAASDAGSTADLALISTLVRGGDTAAALQAIDALERKQPDKPFAAMLRGGVELKRGHRTEARQAYEAALKSDPVYFPAAASLAAMDVSDGKPELAQRRFEQILASDPRHVQAQLAIVDLRGRAGASRQELVEMLGKIVKQSPEAVAPRVALVRLQMERREYKLALALAQEGVSARPESPELLELLGQVQATSGDANQALASFNKLAIMLPESPQPLVRAAELQLAGQDRTAAQQSLKRALAVKPDHAPAQTLLVALLLSQNKAAEARVLVRSIQEQRPQQALGYALEGDLEIKDKNWPKAIAAYKTALDKDGQTGSAIKLHRTLTDAGKAEEATALELRWSKQHQQDAAFIYYLGEAALLRGDQARSLAYYQQVLKLQPDSPAANNNVAWLLHTAKKPGALAYAEKATRLRPEQPAFLDTLAEIHAGEGRLDKALELQRQVVTLAPKLHLHRLHLARYYLQAGQKVEARLELDRLAVLGEQFDRQNEVKKMLAEL